MSGKTNYAVVRDFDVHAFVNGVNEMIEQGWEPQGGVSFANGYFLQAIVLRPVVAVVNTVNVTSVDGPAVSTLVRDGGTA